MKLFVRMRTQREKNNTYWKKCRVFLILSIMLLLSSVSEVKCVNAESLAKFDREVKQGGGNLAKHVVGEMFMPVAITPDSAEHLIDNSGMSGIEAPNHMHACFDSSDGISAEMLDENMYIADTMESITIDLGQKQALGEMYIWNYNDIQHLDDCMKTILVEYSENGTDYFVEGTHILEKSSLSDDAEYYGNVACLIDGMKSVDFAGVTGRYIRITPIDNYGGKRYGLAEIRIFRHKTEPNAGDNLTMDAFAPGQLDNKTIVNAFNNSGMNIINSQEIDNEKHSNRAEDMCILMGDDANTEVDESLLIMNLDGNYPVNTLKLWNYNVENETGLGVKEFEVWYTVDSPCEIVTHAETTWDSGTPDYFDFGKGNWKKLGEYTLPQAEAKEWTEASLTIDFQDNRAQHIKIVPKNNWDGNTDQFGLAEVRAYVNEGWATEYSREWSGMLSSSGTFAYQWNQKANVQGYSLLNEDNGVGWIGGDGIHSVRLNGSQQQGTVDFESKTLFTFQDSFQGNFGNYDGFTYQYGFGNTGVGDGTGFQIGMRNHAFLELTGDEPDPRNMQFYMQLNDGLSEQENYGGNIFPGKYWLGDSTVVNGKIYTIANEFEGLTVNDADFFELNLTEEGFPNMSEVPKKVIDDMTEKKDVAYHETLLEEDGWIYVYGKASGEDIKNEYVVSRVKEENYPEQKEIEYWDGSNWVSNSGAAISVTPGIVPGNECGIVRMNSGSLEGKYILIYTPMSVTGAVCYAVADSPIGPFVKPEDDQLYWSTEKYKLHMRYYSDSPRIYTQWNYNAKPQSAISKKGELLFTYHFGIHDDRGVPAFGYFSSTGKEYEHPTFVKLFDINVITEEDVNENYVVTFDSAGGTNVENQIVESGSKVIKPKNPVKEGYVFAGWYLDDTAYDFDTVVTENITLIAHWEVKKSVSHEMDTESFDSVDNIERIITTNKTEKDVDGSSFVQLRLRVAKSKKNANKLKWNKVAGAEGYLVFANKCGNRMKLVKDVKNGNTKSWQHKKLKKGTYYKYMLIAYKKVEGKTIAIAISKMIHVPTVGGKYTDVKSIKLNKTKVTLKKNKTFKIKVREVKKHKKKKIKNHRKISFESSNKKIATVSKNGKIKAKAKGTCYIYVYAQNGVYKRIKLTVR